MNASNDLEGLRAAFEGRARHLDASASPDDWFTADDLRSAIAVIEEVVELRAENDTCLSQVEMAAEMIAAAEADSSRLRAEVEELRAALRPFAENGLEVSASLADGAKPGLWALPTAGDLRRASDLLSRIESDSREGEHG